MTDLDLSQTTDLRTESDVEQKLLYPLLTAPTPFGLGYDPRNLFTKSNIKGLVIDKGASKKTYFPDYVYTIGGIPLIIVEAKKPGEDLSEAMREARLYAAELNALFNPNIDPVRYLIASDGLRTIAGYSNTVEYHSDLPTDSLSAASSAFSRFQSEFSHSNLQKWYKSILPHIRPKRFWKARKLVGGLALQQEEVGLNSFGVTIASDFHGIFNPISLAERSYIAQHGYIPSKRRERYVEPIDRTIRAAIPPSEKNALTLENSSHPKELTSKLRKGASLSHQTLLLIGSAGAGKTTFVDHLREVALPPDVRQGTRWLHINMNPAPISSSEIYDWLRRQIISECRRIDSTTDFDQLDTLRKMYSDEVEAFRKGTGRLYESNKETYNLKLAGVLELAMSNLHRSAQAHCNYISERYKCLIVIVLDNCDKRLKDEQLLMFEAAQWMKDEFAALLVLPLREETYDNNLHLPPLDTALKDLVFRIEPPRFDLILRNRIELTIRSLNEDPLRQFSYNLPNSMRATYRASDKVSYLVSILKSVFQDNNEIRRLITGLSGRNMRRAMEIFLEFCASGHIAEDYIVRIVQSNGNYTLPINLVSRVLLRSKRRFYDGNRSYVSNIFNAEINDDRPRFFWKLMILKYLRDLSPAGRGPRVRGYVRVEDLLRELAEFGLTNEVIIREINELAANYAIVSEDFRLQGIGLSDLVTIGPAGRVHLQMMSNVHYLAAVAEDLWLRDEALARSIAERIKDPAAQFSTRTVLLNSMAAVRELEHWQKLEIAEYSTLFDDPESLSLLSLEDGVNAVARLEKEVIQPAWLGVESDFAVGKRVKGTVVKVAPYGIFVKLREEVVGLAHQSKFRGRVFQPKRNQTVEVEVLSVDASDRKVELALHAVLGN